MSFNQEPTENTFKFIQKLTRLRYDSIVDIKSYAEILSQHLLIKRFKKL